MSAPLWDVIGLGENSVDYVYRLPWYPQPGSASSKAPITSHDVLPGGQVATTLCACAALGLSVAYIGAFGSDGNGELVRSVLHERGVDLRYSVVRPARNRYAVILVDERAGERVVLWHRDAALQLAGGDVSAAMLRQARLLHVDGVDEEASIEAARMARAAGIPVTCDIDRVTARTPDLLAAVTMPIFAEHVPQALTGEPDPERALRLLQQRQAGMQCVTLGARGAMLLDGGTLHHSAAFPVVVADSTGAGDVFRGAFIHAWLRGSRPAEILRFANAAAAISCTRVGAIGGVPTLDEVEAIVQ